MLTGFPRTIAFAALILPLAACTSGPQQPTDVVDDQGTIAMGEERPADSRTTTTVPDPVVDTTSTGGVRSTSLSALTGSWARDVAACENPDVILSASRLQTLERTCEISDVIDGGQGSYTVGLSCTSSGADIAEAQLVKVSPTDSGMDLSIVGGDSGPQALVRCP